VHGARRGGYPAAAPEGAGAAHRSRSRRSDLLLHHLRLDDVELADLQPGSRRDRGAVRWCAARTVTPDPLGPGSEGTGKRVRNQREVPRPGRKGGA
jgi:hypothetical protein